MTELTQELAKELFEYRDDGVLIWKKARSNVVRVGSVAGLLSPNGRFVVSINRKLYYSHRVIFLWHHGYMPKGVDHDDLNPLNNRIDNLRACNQSENMGNKGKNKNNTSGYKGVYWNKNAKRWHAQITKNRKSIHLGYFKTAEEAHAAYCKAATEIFGEFARAA